MTSLELTHPLVVRYLHDLDRVLLALPTGDAAELREQIVAHLDDAIAPGADDATVQDALDRLGRPADLVPQGTRRRPRTPARLRGARRRTKLGLALVTALVLSAAGWVLVSVIATPPPGPGLRCACMTRIVFAADRPRSSTADGRDQQTFVVRPGWQGIYIEVWNPAGTTQTVLGPAPRFAPWGRQADYHLSVSAEDPDTAGVATSALHFASSADVPPGHATMIRVTWRLRRCVPLNEVDWFDKLPLRVEVAGSVRTEHITFGEAIAITGPAGERCPAG